MCAEIGMNMTTAFCIFAKTMVKEHKIPFEIKADSPNVQTIETIEQVKRMRADPSIGKTYTNVDQMMQELLDV